MRDHGSVSSGAHLKEGWAAKPELVKDLAEIERELSRKLDEARQAAERRVAEAEEEARRILTDSDAEIRQMADTFRVRMAEEGEKIAGESNSRAEAEAEHIRQKAEQNIDRAVDFVLSEVVP